MAKSEYIKRDDAMKTICSNCTDPCALVEKANNPCSAIKELVYLPSADVVEVVRCKDCRYWTEWGSGTGSCQPPNSVMWCGTDATDFCSFAERKDDE